MHFPCKTIQKIFYAHKLQNLYFIQEKSFFFFLTNLTFFPALGETQTYTYVIHQIFDFLLIFPTCKKVFIKTLDFIPSDVIILRNAIRKL